MPVRHPVTVLDPTRCTRHAAGQTLAVALAERVRRRESPVFVQCIVYLAFAMPAALVGVVWTDARETFDQPSSALGFVTAAYGIGRLSTSASAGYLLARVGLRRPVAGACVGLAIANVVALAVPVWPVFLFTFLVIGVLSGVLDSMGGRFLAIAGDVGGAALMAGSYGVGATLAPGLVALTAWRVGFALAAVVSLIAAVLAAGRFVQWPEGLVAVGRANPSGSAPSVSAQSPGRGFSWLPVVASLGLFATIIGLEVTTANWAATFLEEGRDFGGRAGGIATSAFWAGITIGRLALGRVLDALGTPPTSRVLTISISAMVGAIALAAFAPAAVAIGSFGLVGLMLGPAFPSLMATTAERVGSLMAGRVSGWQLIAGNIGGTGLAALTGVVVELSSAWAPIVMIAGAAGVTLLLLRLAVLTAVKPT